MELEESGFLTSDYTAELQSSKPYGTCTKIEICYQWNKIDSPKIHPCTYGQLNYNKGGKNIQIEKKSLFNVAGKN